MSVTSNTNLVLCVVFVYYNYSSKTITYITMIKTVVQGVTTNGTPDSVPKTKNNVSGNDTGTQTAVVLAATAAERSTMVNSDTKMRTIASTTSSNSSQESSEAGTMVKNNSDKYICTYIDSEYDIKPTSVPEQISEKIFIATTVKNEKKVNKEIELEEQPAAYEKEYVPILDEFTLDVDDDDDI